MSTISRRELCTGLGGAAGLASVAVPAAVTASEATTPRSRPEYSAGRARKTRELVGWEPIETAPRDGTLVVLLCPESWGDDRIVLACWNEKCAAPPAPVGCWYGGAFGWEIQNGFGGMWIAEGVPTHWLPLPEEPDEVRYL